MSFFPPSLLRSTIVNDFFFFVVIIYALELSLRVCECECAHFANPFFFACNRLQVAVWSKVCWLWFRYCDGFWKWRARGISVTKIVNVIDLNEYRSSIVPNDINFFTGFRFLPIRRDEMRICMIVSAKRIRTNWFSYIKIYGSKLTRFHELDSFAAGQFTLFTIHNVAELIASTVFTEFIARNRHRMKIKLIWSNKLVY